MMEWRDIRGCTVRYQSGSKIGVLGDLYLSEKGGRISHLTASPPLIWRITRGQLLTKITVPTEMAQYRPHEISISDKFHPGDVPDTGRLPRLSKLNNSEVFAGRGWRIGRLVGARFDPGSWSLEQLEIDTYPEYLISTGTHSLALPKGFPPVARVTVGGDGVEFRTADEFQGSFSVIIAVGGEKIEESLVELLADPGEVPIEDRKDVIQRAFDMAYNSN